MVTFLDLGRFGRLGNQLFQVASTIGIALKNNQDYSFPNWYCYHSNSNYENIFSENLPKLNFNKQIVRVNEKSFNYNDIILPNEDVIYSLHGYFQSEKYFKNYKEEIKKYFTPKKEIIQDIYLKYKNILNNSCSIHIRRGDYLHQINYHPVLSLKYYWDAIDFLYGENKKNVNFLIFSDDINWVKNNLKIPNMYFIEGNNNFYDMFLMSECENNIIANSSFSWWGAWLNKNEKKKIIAPKEWFGSAIQDTSIDLYCDNWIIL
jgi:hypothetical protein